MAKIIVLANSKQHGGRCIAGIDKQNGQWVRPVQAIKHAIPEYPWVQKIKLLDIVEIPLKDNKLKECYQRENRIIASWDWEVIGNISPKEILCYCEDSHPILHSNNDRVDPESLDKLPFEQWKSLQLVRTRVSFSRDTWEHSRWRANFSTYALKVTDPYIVCKLNKNETIASDCLLTISLARPWRRNDTYPYQCYKLVAGVIEL